MGLEKLLKDVLPKGDHFEALHLRNVPIETHPLITAKHDTNEPAPLTIKTQHLFVLFYQGKVIYGLEIYVYLTLKHGSSSLFDAERTIFISKADTTGYADCKLSYKNVTKAIIQYILSLDPNAYLQNVLPKERDYSKIDPSLITKKTSAAKALRIISNRLNQDSQPLRKPLDEQLSHSYQCSHNVKTKLCLFTRPAAEYLFAASSKNPRKHVVDGERLLKWWIDILDEILLETFRENTEAKMRIPGEDPINVKRYLRSTKYGHWEAGDVFGNNGKDLAAFRLPLFPDDPKTRFLRQLVEEDRIYKTDLSTFWTELQERQEFKLSVIVSVIGIYGHVAEIPCNLPSTRDQIEASSRRQFNSIKNYITGEEYDVISGATEAYVNVRDFLKIKLNRKLLQIIGDCQTGRKSKTAERQEVVTTLQVRKRPKKI